MTNEEQRRVMASVGGMDNILLYADGRRGRPVRATILSLAIDWDAGGDYTAKACLIDCTGREWEGVDGSFLDVAPA